CNSALQQWWSLSPDGTVHVGYNDKCLDADLATIGANGTKVQLWDCNGQAQQRWILDDADGTLRNASSNRCLDADGANGTRVQLWDCNGGPQQRWHWAFGPSLRVGADGRCLNADVNTIGANGTKVQLWDCNHGRE